MELGGQQGDYPGGPASSQRSLPVEEGGRRGGQRDPALLDLKAEEGAMRQEFGVTSRSRKGKDMTSPLEPL